MASSFQTLRDSLNKKGSYFVGYRERTLPFFQLVRGLPQILGSYFLWFALLLMTQAVEVYILAYTHHLYAPGISLKALRTLSVITVFGFLVLFPLRSEPSRIHGKVSRFDEHSFLKIVAQILFLVSALIAALLEAYLVFFSDLLLVTAPLMRAVLLAGIVSLPFDVLLIYLFYNLSKLGVPWLTFRPRIVTLVSLAASLLALSIGNIPLFLVLKITPKAFLAVLLWRSCGGRILDLFFISHESIRRHCSQIVALGRAFLPLALSFLFFDLSMLFLGKGIVRSDSAIGLLLFVVHKLSHLAYILSFRVILTGHRALHSVLRYGTARDVRETLSHSFSLGALFILLSFTCIPLLLFQRELFGFSWIEGDSILPLSFVVISTFLRVFLAITLILSWLRDRTSWTSTIGTGALFIFSFLLAINSWRLNFWFETASLMTLIFFTDLLLVGAALSLLLCALMRAPLRFKTPEGSLLSWLSLQEKKNWHLPILIVQAWRGNSLLLEELLSNLRSKFSSIRWDKERFLLFSKHTREVSRGDYDDLLSRSTPYARSIRTMEATSLSDFIGSISIDEKEYLDLPASPIAVRKGRGWEVSSHCTREEKNLVFSYLNEIEEHSDPMTPAAYLGRHAKGFVFTSQNGEPFEIFHIPILQRHNITSLRKACLFHSISSALSLRSHERRTL